MELKFTSFVRKPFSVEAVQVNEENMKEVAKLLGRVQKEPNGVRYIQVHKGKVPNVTKVYLGYWVTRLSESNTNLRVYSTKTFAREFSPFDVPKTAEIVRSTEFPEPLEEEPEEESESITDEDSEDDSEDEEESVQPESEESSDIIRDELERAVWGR